jgi:hypothetical protein
VTPSAFSGTLLIAHPHEADAELTRQLDQDPYGTW